MDFQPGDLLACYGRGLIGRGISLVTSSPFAPRGLRFPPSHVAIVAEWGGDRLWIESTTLCGYPCAILGRKVSGVQAHLPECRIDDYTRDGGRIDVYRLSPIDKLSQPESDTLSHVLVKHFIGSEASYDTGGALLSGTRAFQLLRIFPGSDLNRVFCSELIAAVLMRLGRMNRDNPTRYNPGRLLRQLVRQGTYQRAFTVA